jgi:hypothetical protein
MCAEIQVRTVLQHAWAAIDHKLAYKSDHTVPRELRRDLNRLSALLELADKEFSGLQAAVDALEERYAESVDRGDLDLDLDASSLPLYLRSRDVLQKLARLGVEAGMQESGHAADLDDEEVDQTLWGLREALIFNVEALDTYLADVDEWAPELLGELNERAKGYGFHPFAIGADILAWLALIAGNADFETISLSQWASEIDRALSDVIGNPDDGTEDGIGVEGDDADAGASE